jgi:hypothetical protein
LEISKFTEGEIAYPVGGKLPMDLEYDLFERMSDGSLSWKGFTKGLEDARLRLARLATETTNECFAVNVATGNVVDRAKIPTGKKEISYDLRILRVMAVVLCTGVEAVLLITRKLMLERAGYIVVVAVTKPAIIEACQQHAFHVAVVGQEDTPEKKNSVFSLIRRYSPSTKVLEVYPIEVGRTLKSADDWLALPKQEPTELIERVTNLLRRVSPRIQDNPQ